MTGRKLYDRYVIEMADQNIAVDEWDDLPEAEQRAWDVLAEWLSIQAFSSS